MTPESYPNRSTMPSLGKHLKLKINDPTHIILDNGVDAYFFNGETEEVVKIEIVFNAGTSLQPKNLVSGSTIRMLTAGTKSMSSAEIAHKIDYLGAYLNTSSSKDDTTITIHSLSRHLPKLLPIVSDFITNAVFPEDELSNYLLRRKNKFSTNISKIKFRAMVEFNSLIFGSDSAYGRTLKLSDFDNILRSDIVDFYHRYYTAKNMYVIVSGFVNDSTKTLVNDYLGNGIPVGEKQTDDTIIFTNMDNQKEKFIRQEGSLQSAICVGRNIVDSHHPDQISLTVLNTVLGNYFGSRLMSNLREDKGYTYGVSSEIVNYKNGCFLNISTQVNAQFTTAAINEINKEITRLRNEKIGKQELDLVKNYIYGSTLHSLSGPMDMAGYFRQAKSLNLDNNYFANKLTLMMKQTPQQLLETANKYLNYDDMLTLVVGEMGNS